MTRAAPKRLNTSQYFTLSKWLESNRELADKSNNAVLAKHATEALGIPVVAFHIDTARKATGIPLIVGARKGKKQAAVSDLNVIASTLLRLCDELGIVPDNRAVLQNIAKGEA